MERVTLTTQTGSTISAILSEPRLGLADALAGLQPSMRLLTTDPVSVGDLLTGPDGSRYRVLRIMATYAGLLCEVAKEA